MSLSTALHGALSGLSAAGRASGVVSENIANALTPGYAKRSIILSSNSEVSPGVRVLGIQRQANPGIISSRRQADAEFSNANPLASFQTRFASAVGNPTDTDSITARLAAFDSSLISASSRPDSAQRLDDVAIKANDLVNLINNASDTVQKMRSEADRKISIQVERLNKALSDVEDLNVRITALEAGNAPTAALLDQRQVLIDEINNIAPVNVVERNYGQVALYTIGGAVLLDGQAATLEFTPVNTIVPEMTLTSGGLSGLTLNGNPIRTDSLRGALRGGSLSAQFEIRDELGVEAQAELDSVARDLIERFEDPALDPTLSPGDPGLFTDNGNTFDPLTEIGLSARLRVNPDADPEQGGESWRLRDGLGAVAPGPSGDARFLQSLQSVLETARVPGSGNFGTGALTASEISGALVSSAAQAEAVSDQRLVFSSASLTEMKNAELSQGVDSDEELSQLILIEQAYAANARMLQVVDELMETLLRL